MTEFNTPLETLYACRNHWSWLAITGSACKPTYNPSKKWAFYCACCEYIRHKRNGYNGEESICNYCPLTGYAWDRSDDFETVPCDSGCTAITNSIYESWTIVKGKESRTKYALQMVQACNRAIEDILLNSSDEEDE